ncbi:hypothetical protein [Wolbachia endosymbiont (group B) of Episyrphus balteatus]|uniref:hypothetical protein n=1 Tax=Wolbachia endosymbiont (group B) of Episyrphus balteatus TaxID=2954009 RepID=UPI0022260B2E|nr:hypothetical protein [Wolbachia endosymbiont (group B) of Episyrphus balteatus]
MKDEFGKDEFGVGNREKCNKICTRGKFFDKECSDKCLYQLIRSADGHTDDVKKCLVENVKGKCDLKIVDVGCMTGAQDLPKTYAIPGYDPNVGNLLIESKAKELHNCHRNCEDKYSSWDLVGRGKCKVNCDERYPTNGDMCDEVLPIKKCADECKSAMSTMYKLSQAHAAEMDTYDLMSV